MDKAQALYAFWASFGWPAIDEDSAYDDAAMKALGYPDHYIEYESAWGEIGEPVSLTASVWQRSSAWTDAEEKARLIYDTIGQGGTKVDFDGGQLWITRREPFAKRGPTVDPDMRRITININAEYLSA